MNFKLLFISLALCTSATFIGAQQVPTFTQQNVETMMASIYEQVMPAYKKVYKNNYEKIDWLEHNYVLNTAEGDAFIASLALEMQEIFAKNCDAMIETSIKQMNTFTGQSQKLSKEEKEQFKKMMLDMMPGMMVEGIRQGAMLKSSVYQELLKENKIKK